MYFIGYDIGSSSVKASIVDPQTGKTVAEAHSPSTEMEISSPEPGFAEQHPDLWWEHLCIASRQALTAISDSNFTIGGIGISYQMHGLVLVDSCFNPVRPAIIWCDSRAVSIGDTALEELGADSTLPRLLNSPGNFTASKLAWVKQNEPDSLSKAAYMLLPGDYIALRMTGLPATTLSGLSEGTLWDYSTNSAAHWLLEHFEVPTSLLPEIVPTFGEQGVLVAEAAEELGLPPGVPVAYRAGDQPNNALSLGVLEPGEVAATAGTSGVLYAVTDTPLIDEQMRVNSFAHVNFTATDPRYGVLLCVNGTGILNSWLKNTLFTGISYEEMNREAIKTPIGADGLLTLPYGNGAERTLGNTCPGAGFSSIDFNRHSRGHLLRSAQEGIACALRYGLTALEEQNFPTVSIRAGRANMFLSPLFRNAVAALTRSPVHLFQTDGATGAAFAAAYGAGFCSSLREALAGLTPVETLEPDKDSIEKYSEVYQKWSSHLQNYIGEENEQ